MRYSSCWLSLVLCRSDSDSAFSTCIQALLRWSPRLRTRTSPGLPPLAATPAQRSRMLCWSASSGIRITTRGCCCCPDPAVCPRCPSRDLPSEHVSFARRGRIAASSCCVGRFIADLHRRYCDANRVTVPVVARRPVQRRSPFVVNCPYTIRKVNSELLRTLRAIKDVSPTTECLRNLKMLRGWSLVLLNVCAFNGTTLLSLGCSLTQRAETPVLFRFFTPSRIPHLPGSQYAARSLSKLSCHAATLLAGSAHADCYFWLSCRAAIALVC